MCGIMGYTGTREALPILLAGLDALEYRGYDSAGIAVSDGVGVCCVKSRGRIDALREKLSSLTGAFSCGIGHTRWATHGAPSDRNAHPHRAGHVILVHNGIVENEAALRAILLAEGVSFCSETDTEVAAAWINRAYERTGDPVAALGESLSGISGSYAFAILFDDRPGEIYAARRSSPLLVAKDATGAFLSSDPTALLPYTDEVLRLEEGEMAVLSPTGFRLLAGDGRALPMRPMQKSTWSREAAQKDGFAHFMRKEIAEEPTALRQTVARESAELLSEAALSRLAGARRLHIVACGTAMHAGLLGGRMFESMAGIETDVSVASEFRYHPPLLRENDVVLAISQSGETADTLAAMRLARERKLYLVSIVNVVGSGVARESDDVLYTAAGPEIAVASTKAYIVQLAALFRLAMALGVRRGLRTHEEERAWQNALQTDVPAAIEAVLKREDAIRAAAERVAGAEHLFCIGRGQDAFLAEEASLKTKEISYIHSEAYPAGELKHGTISLITDGVPVLAIATEPALYAKLLGNIREVRARGAEVILLAAEDFPVSASEASAAILLPRLATPLMAFPTATAFQLFAYHTALLRGCDVDKPRNLAKSVTVE